MEALAPIFALLVYPVGVDLTTWSMGPGKPTKRCEREVVASTHLAPSGRSADEQRKGTAGELEPLHAGVGGGRTAGG